MVLMIALDWYSRKTFFSCLSVTINFSNRKTRFCSSLHYNGNESYLHVNKAESCKFKMNDNIYWYNFCLRSISKDSTKDERRKISLNSNVYNFSS